MEAGRVVETGTPIELYRRPRHSFTAQFLGHTNLLELQADGAQAWLACGTPVPLLGVVHGTVRLSVRPEDVALVADAAGLATVVDVSFVGAQAHYAVRIGERTLRASVSGSGELLSPGQTVSVAIRAAQLPLLTHAAGPAAREGAQP